MDKISNFFRDRDRKIVIVQLPNWPIWGIIGLLIIGRAFDQTKGIALVGIASLLFIWGVLELTSGVNLFRRILGLVAIAWIIRALFLNFI